MANSPLNKANSPAPRPLIYSAGFFTLLILFVGVKIMLIFSQTGPAGVRASDLSTTNILSAINQQRQLRNLVILNQNDKLTGAAQYKSNDMINRRYFAHVDPDGHYIWDKIVSLGYTPYLQLGENLAIEFYDTESLVNAWMASPTHRANILQEGFRDQGMGLGFGDVAQGQYYSSIANTFGTLAPTPQSKKTTPAPVLKMPVKTPAPAKPSTKTTPAPRKPATQKTLGSEQSASSAPVAEETPAPSPLPSPITPREEVAFAQNQQDGFALPDATSSTSTAPGVPSAPDTLVGPAQNHQPFSNYQLSRYLTLAAGLVLLFLMLWDIKKARESDTEHIDKKTNNVILLVFAIIVVAFIYWL